MNLFGVVNGIAALLPAVRAAAATSPAAVVITGSKQGITNPPGNPAYNASKAAVKTVAEHLSFDLRGEDNVSVHLLVPGWTFTGLSGNRPGSGGEKPEGAWWPDQVADFLEKKMADGQFWVLCPDGQVTEELVSLASRETVDCKQGIDVAGRTARECSGALRMRSRAGRL